jgi:serine/threonine protein kinase
MKLLGKGAFGQVYLALDLLTCQQCAMKIELPNTKKPVLKLEISVIRKVLNSPYFPNYIGCGRFMPPFTNLPKSYIEDNAYSYFVMELLGPR